MGSSGMIVHAADLATVPAAVAMLKAFVHVGRSVSTLEIQAR